MKFRMTRHGIYLYHRRFTLSFSWGYLWHWLPERTFPDCNGGWSIYWGWWCLELLRWDEGDDWGERWGKSMSKTLEWLTREIQEV